MNPAASGAEHMFSLIASLPDQLRRGVDLPGAEQASKVGRGARRILVCGMGGSAIAADLTAPLLDVGRIGPHRDYGLPRWIEDDTLVVLSSYSGGTEEVLQAAREVRGRGLRVVVLSSGGSLPEIADSPAWIRVPTGLPPRASLGYGLGALLRLCGDLGLLRSDLADISTAADALAARTPELGPEAGDASTARALARNLLGRTALLHTTSAENHAVGRRWRAQIQENGKQPAFCSTYPELNHNEVEARPADEDAKPALVLLRGGEEHPRVGRRVDVTTTLLADRYASLNMVPADGVDPLTRILLQVQFGDYVSCHLAALRGIDPVPVSTISELKERLQKGETS